jgi:hypothetical protein
MQYIHQNNLPIRIPVRVAQCPVCNGELYVADITEWERDENGDLQVTEIGFDVDCGNPTENCLDHWTYDDGLAVDDKVHRWLIHEFRFYERTEEEERARLAAWNAGKPRIVTDTENILC